ncbi:hypothetical protein HPB49_005611 [Dermacentor silvarum]|uniref:Uncharacterized protein n=1 Tax=Dermacentor silvarum TaxID=543639 RepID=A0ACB8DVM0_DERSI|nr:hypothetical protein HPB49_005611 [Dermacentor silvarum]
MWQTRPCGRFAVRGSAELDAGPKVGGTASARREQTCGVSAPPILGWGLGPNHPTQAKLASSDPEHRAEQLDTKFVQAPSLATPKPTPGRVESALRGQNGDIRGSALQLRGYDLEEMAWTLVPTTSDENWTVFPKIRGQAVLQVAERRSQDKAKMKASNAAPAPGSSVGNVNAPATHATGRKGKASTKWKPRPMLKPAPEHYVIIIKPRERIFLHEACTKTGYGTAMSAYLGPERARATFVLPSRDQNIIIVHTLDIEAADRLIGDIGVNTEKGSVPLHGYLGQDGGNTCHGVIVVRNTDTTETLQQRVCWRAGTIVAIRKFGTSNKARITFAGKEKPRYVHYDSMVVSVQNYYTTIPACGQCGAVGHHADACPNLQPNTCGLCRLYAPLVKGVRAPHNCVPRCFVCGGAHATNSRDCAEKFRTPKMAAQKDGKKKMAPNNKSRHLGPPSDQPPPRGGLKKRAAEMRGKTGAYQCRQKRTPGERFGRGCFFPTSHSPRQARRAPSKIKIAALRAQNKDTAKEN